MCGLTAPGIMLSINRSRLAFPTQVIFLILNGLGVAFGTVYNVNTPDLYENNSHHRIGWIATWVMSAQVGMSLLFIHSGGRRTPKPASQGEQATFLPVSMEAMAQHNMRPYAECRWSGDSGQGTERSSMHNSRDVSPTDPTGGDSFESYKSEAELDEEHDKTQMRSDRRGLLRNHFLGQYLSRHLPGMSSCRLHRIVEVLYDVIDRTSLLLGFVALTTGGVTYAGIFVSSGGLHT